MQLENNYVVGDNLEILKQVKDETFDLIYMDPPYNTGRNFSDFNDKFESMNEYANAFLKPRLVECRRALKKEGNIVVHVEPRNSHHVRMVLDEVFGERYFKNEIAWKSGGNAKNKKQLGRYHDTIIVYGKCNESIFNPEYKPYDEEYKKSSSAKYCETRKDWYVTTAIHNSQPDVNPRMNLRYEWGVFDLRLLTWNSNHKQWYVSKEKMQFLHEDDRLLYNKRGIPRIKRFLSEMDGIPVRDLWTDITQIQHGEKLNYATQKPVKLLERIVKMYSQEGSLIADPFAGSGTLGRAAMLHNRNYFLVDINQEGEKVFVDSIINVDK